MNFFNKLFRLNTPIIKSEEIPKKDKTTDLPKRDWIPINKTKSVELNRCVLKLTTTMGKVYFKEFSDKVNEVIIANYLWKDILMEILKCDTLPRISYVDEPRPSFCIGFYSFATSYSLSFNEEEIVEQHFLNQYELNKEIYPEDPVQKNIQCCKNQAKDYILRGFNCKTFEVDNTILNSDHVISCEILEISPIQREIEIGGFKVVLKQDRRALQYVDSKFFEPKKIDYSKLSKESLVEIIRQLTDK